MRIIINFVQIISQKRDRHELTRSEIAELISGYTNGIIPDYQMSAFAMAVLLNGMTLDETVALTEAMLHSGEILHWPDPSVPVVDKHSTGGIGDKVSIHLAPMLACCGVKVPMISGRGLGPTGGTLDKLEAIPGFRTDLSISEIQTQVDEVGCVITGASPELAPADRKLYALRDVTATVESIPLITASILSKKLAAGLNALVLDVKFGSGAFMPTIESATELAHSIVAVGNGLGVKTTALITDMNQTLGTSAGNAIEVQESIELLQGKADDDLLKVTIELGAALLNSVDPQDLDDHRKRLQKCIESGDAFEKFNEMVQAQGGTEFHYAPKHAYPVKVRLSGSIQSIDAKAIGLAVIELGGGRKKLGDQLDLDVGIRQLARIGVPVNEDDSAFEIVASRPITQSKLDAAIKLLENSITVTADPPPHQDPIHAVVT